MTRPILSICTRCDGGERLHDEVAGLREVRGLEGLFVVDDVACLNRCDDPIAIELHRAGRPCITRIRVPPNAGVRLVDAVVASCTNEVDTIGNDHGGEHAGDARTPLAFPGDEG